MKISACSGVGYGNVNNTTFGSPPKRGRIKPSMEACKSVYTECGSEAPDMKRLSVMVGMTSLVIMSGLLALSGKICNCARI